MSPQPQDQPASNPIPVELELYINPDGSVTFADLAAEVVPLALILNPDDELVCHIPAKESVDSE